MLVKFEPRGSDHEGISVTDRDCDVLGLNKPLAKLCHS